MNRKIQICHIVESFAAGVLYFIIELINGLSEFDHIIVHGIRETTPKDYQNYFPPNTRFYYWKSVRREINPFNDIKSFLELYSIIKQIGDFDVIHLHSSKAGFLGRLVSRLSGLHKKVIYTPHGVSFLRKDVSKIKKNIFVFLEKIGSILGGEIVACSPSEAKEFQKYHMNAKYIINGIDCSYMQMIKEKEIVAGNKLYIGNSGRITAQKNPGMFNDIAEYFYKNPNVEFIWIGDGELRNLLTCPNIIITGWLTMEETVKKMRIIDIYLSTSLWEGLSISALQAMCLGKPLILHSCVGNIDLVEDNQNGFVFRTAEEAIFYIEKFIVDRDKIIQMGKHSQELASTKFSLNRMLEEYKKLYLRLANPLIP